MVLGSACFAHSTLSIVREKIFSLRDYLTKGKRGGVALLEMWLEGLELNAKNFEDKISKEARKRISCRVCVDDIRVRASADEIPGKIDKVEFIGARLDQIAEMRRILAVVSSASGQDLTENKGRREKLFF